MRRLTAEFVGTFALVFAGTGAIIINDVSGGMVTHVGVALTFGCCSRPVASPSS
jgi:aquaporin Z